MEQKKGPLVLSAAALLFSSHFAYSQVDIKSRSLSNKYIVVLDKGGDSRKDPERKKKLKAKAYKLLDDRRVARSSAKKFYTDVVGGFSAELNELDVQELEKDPRVLRIEQDQTYSISALYCPVPVSQPSQTLPWGTRRVGYADGTGKTAWVVDSGIDLCHPDLNVDVNRSRSFVDTSGGQDGNGHGTHVAGVIGAKNNSIGTRGVASNAKLVAVKVLSDSGSSSGSSVLAGLDYVYQNVKTGEVVNLSLGGGASTTLDDAVKRIAAKGAWVTIAAGNSSIHAGNTSPARANATRLYTVSAFSSGDYFASFSNYGNPPIDYSQPGKSILSTYKGGTYAYLSGTSMAAPHLAGLLLIKNGAVRTGAYVKNDPDGKRDKIGIK